MGLYRGSNFWILPGVWDAAAYCLACPHQVREPGVFCSGFKGTSGKLAMILLILSIMHDLTIL